jgi:hypothetical protein
MSKFGDAVFVWMTRANKRAATSKEIWDELGRSRPELVVVSGTRKTPRTTMMRDLRKDSRFVVGGGTVALANKWDSGHAGVTAIKKNQHARRAEK